MKLLNNLVSFLLELAMLAAFGYWGFHVNAGTMGRWLLGIGVPLLVVAFWSVYMAPNATARLPWPWLPFVALALFIASSVALYAAGSKSLAVTFAIVAVINTALVLLWRQQ